MGAPGPHPHWQERSIQLFGPQRHGRIAAANVLVAGMGGVGAMAAEMICRSGVGRMTIIDADTIQPGNLRLFNLRPHFGLPQYKAHNALYDALATAELFLAMAAEMAPNGNYKIGDFINA